MSRPLGNAGIAPLSREAEALYLEILSHGGDYSLAAASIDEDPPARELFDCGLLGVTDPNAEILQFTAVDPLHARHRWQAYLRQRALADFAALESVDASFDQLVGAYDGSQAGAPGSGGGYELVSGRREINARIGQLLAAATREVLTLQPGERPAGLLQNITDRDLDTAQRVVWRTLYESSSSGDRNVQQYVAVLSAAGAQFRTTPKLIGRLVVIDGNIAIVPAPAPETNLTTCFITDPTTVHYLCRLHDSIWRSAHSLVPQLGSIAPLSAVQEQIIALLQKGLDQAQIQRRTGLRARSCSGHIADLKRLFGVTTLFQLGVEVAKSPLSHTSRAGVQ